jgi:putative ABC transport system permease protein
MSYPASSGSTYSSPVEARAPWLSRAASGLRSDVRQTLRQFRKSKGIIGATLATLALCIGSTTAIFSMVYSLMLKPLPFSEPERIVELYTSAVKAGLNKMPGNVVMYLDYSANATAYQTLGLWTQNQSMLGEDGSVERVWAARATAEMFDVLRVQPILGQFFTKEQSLPGEDKVVVLTRSYWESKFAWDPEIIGKTLRLDGETVTVIGVAPQVLEAFDARVKLIRPLSWNPAQVNPGSRYGVGIALFGRLKPGATVEQADAEAKTIEKRYYDASPPPVRQFVDRSGMTMNVGGVQAQRVGPVKTTLYLLQGGVAFVLLIGCVNVANLLLVRSNARQSELAIRFALGATRGVIARQLLVESLVLTGLGAVLGIGLAWGALHAVNQYTSELLPQALPMALDFRVLGFAIVLAIVVGVFIGLIPIVHLLRTNLSELIHRSSRAASAGRGVRTLSSLLVVGQVAVALMLLTGAGLLIHGFIKALNIDPGFDPRGVIGTGITLPAAHRTSDETARAVQDRLIQAMEEIPGVSASMLTYSIPFRGGVGINALTLADDPLPPGSPQPGAYRVTVTPGYFDTLKLRLVEGRFFERGDLAPGPPRFVVDESFAKKFFHRRSAIGGKFTFGPPPAKDTDWPTIIGVVRDIPHNGVEEKSGNPFIYQLLQGRPGGFGLYVRSERSAGDTISAMREKIRQIDPTITMLEARTLESAMDESFDTRRAVMLLMVAFAGMALFLSALGIYGVLAYDVSQRTREIGIRGAIGATRAQIVEMVLKQGLWKALIGLAVGLIGAWSLSRTMTSLLFQVTPNDPVVYAAVSALLLLVTVLASYLPARRAAKIDPLVALRAE